MELAVRLSQSKAKRTVYTHSFDEVSGWTIDGSAPFGLATHDWDSRPAAIGKFSDIMSQLTEFRWIGARNVSTD